jgi:hypothetical protein
MEKEHKLILTDSERGALVEVLQSYLSDLSYEIADTDSHDFREGLKSKRALLEKVVAQLQAS